MAKLGEFVGSAATVNAFPLVVGGQWFSPYLIDEPGNGLPVLGEVFNVDNKGLAFLDELEGVGVPNAYRRVQVEVWSFDRKAVSENVWTYVKDRDNIDIIHSNCGEVYSDFSKYIFPKDRSTRF